PAISPPCWRAPLSTWLPLISRNGRRSAAGEQPGEPPNFSWIDPSAAAAAADRPAHGKPIGSSVEQHLHFRYAERTSQSDAEISLSALIAESANGSPVHPVEKRRAVF